MVWSHHQSLFQVELSNEDIVEIECLRDVAMATNFGITLVVNGLGREITTWGFRIKDSLFSVNPLRLIIVLSGFELRRSELLQAATVR